MNTMVLALALFAGMYVLLLIFADYRWIIALAVSFPLGMLLLVPIAPFFAEKI